MKNAMSVNQIVFSTSSNDIQIVLSTSSENWLRIRTRVDAANKSYMIRQTALHIFIAVFFAPEDLLLDMSTHESENKN